VEHLDGRINPRRMLLAVCAAVAIAAPIVMLTYPIPNVPGGWCASGGRPGHYTVETVARIALWAEILAVAGIVLLVAGSRTSWAGRVAVGVVWGLAGAVIIYVAWFFYAGRIDCAFS
jgi:hypothetical protein